MKCAVRFKLIDSLVVPGMVSVSPPLKTIQSFLPVFPIFYFYILGCIGKGFFCRIVSFQNFAPEILI